MSDDAVKNKYALFVRSGNGHPRAVFKFSGSSAVDAMTLAVRHYSRLGVDANKMQTFVVVPITQEKPLQTNWFSKDTNGWDGDRFYPRSADN